MYIGGLIHPTPFFDGEPSGKSNDSGIGFLFPESANQLQRMLEASPSKEYNSLSKLWGEAKGSKENKSLFVVLNDPVQTKNKFE